MDDGVRTAGESAPSFALALEGLDDAMERLGAGGLYRKAAIAAAEALFWVSAARDALRDAALLAEDYAGPESARFLNGLHYARNRSAHELLEMTEPAGGLTFPQTFPFSIQSRPVWAGSDSRLLPAGRGAQQARDRAAYLELVAGREPMETLRAARGLLLRGIQAKEAL